MEHSEGILGCCGLASLQLLTGMRAAELRAMIAWLKRAGYSGILASTNPHIVQKEAAKLLRTKGFKPLTKFTNKNTLNQVTIWFLNLNPRQRPHCK